MTLIERTRLAAFKKDALVRRWVMTLIARGLTPTGAINVVGYMVDHARKTQRERGYVC